MNSIKKRKNKQKYNICFVLILYPYGTFTRVEEEYTGLDLFKKRTYKDMKDRGYKITKEFLRKYGFSVDDIEYLIEKGEKIS